MIRDYENQDPADALVTSMAQERDINTFFRLQSPTVVAKLAEEFPGAGRQSRCARRVSKASRTQEQLVARRSPSCLMALLELSGLDASHSHSSAR